MASIHDHKITSVRGPGTPARGFALAAATGGLAMLSLADAIVPAAGAGALAAGLGFYGIAAAWAGVALRNGYPHARLGLCNLVTLLRLVMTAALVSALIAGVGPSWPVFGLAAVALALDGVDGWLARAQGLASRFGARFDMEVDSALALTLALSAATGGALGPAGAVAAALLGLPRYAFGLAGLAAPWLRAPLPERFSRKAVCVVQLGALIALQAPILPDALALPLAGIAAAALIWSFAVDLRWLWRQRPSQDAPSRSAT
jgi:phosphatidylglycerophosphate synthase